METIYYIGNKKITRSEEGEKRRIEAVKKSGWKVSKALKGKIPKNLESIREKAWASTRKENLTYSGIHAWVRRNWGQAIEAGKCELCGIENLGSWKIHWANKDHKYSRNREDWMRVCRPCHAEYDKKFNGINFTRKSVRK